MSNTLKTMIIGLAVIILAGLGWKFYIDKNYSDLGDIPITPQEQASKDDTGASDASLDKDLSIIDAELDTLSGDSASIDQGLNDKPIPQAE